MSSRTAKSDSRKRAPAADAPEAIAPTLPAHTEPPTTRSHLIVGIGASAGGLDAFKSFFTHMPADSGMAFVLVQHLAPQHASLLVDLLSRSTTMPMAEAADGLRVEPGHVYVIPPDATLTIEHGVLKLTRPAPPRQHRWPIDTFFSSLAEDQGDCAVCVVLSGSGSDGARGLRAIKEHGGLALAQARAGTDEHGDEHTAMMGMPASAAATGLVDDVLRVEAMPARLIAHDLHLRDIHDRKGPDGTRQDLAAHLLTISSLLRAEVGHDFSQYKEKTLVRRIQRRMQVLQAATVPDYITHLRDDPREVQHLFRELLIGVTEFFRDPPAFAALQATAIPALLAGKSAADTLRVWVPGCATGEEAYSIAIALKEAMAGLRGEPKVQIFATDIDDGAIAAARAGRYRKPLPGVSAERQERWFNESGDAMCVIKSLREMCVFSPHSAIKDPPFSRLDLVSCRNLLIYMNPGLQERLVKTFHYALKPGGFLLLGPSEGLGRNNHLFSVLDKKQRLYGRRNDTSNAIPITPPGRSNAAVAGAPRAIATVPGSGGEDRIDRVARRTLEKHAPAYVVIDANHDILRFAGNTGRYLEPASGAASLNLFGLLHIGLRAAARAAVQQAFAENRTVVKDGLTIAIDGHRQPLRLIAEPLPDSSGRVGDGTAQLCMVAFNETQRRPHSGETAAAVVDPDAAEDVRLHALEQELDSTRNQLHAAISQLESANEEMMSANEEYQSVNEELQSSNEELETSKEEMQSINEELQTVNAEMQNKNEALAHLNNDLQNLLESTQIATLFLNSQLHVTGFTPATTELFNLRDGDRGRPITEITARVQYPELWQDVQQVLRTLTLVERELRNAETGAVYVLRMRPYRTVDNRIDGVVLTFVDITERQQHEFERARLAAIVDSSSDAIIGHTLDGTVTSWNAGAEAMFGYPTARMLGKPLSGLLPPHAADALQPLLRSCANNNQAVETEMVWLREHGAPVDVALTCSPIRDLAGQVIAGATIARDITERKRLDAALHNSEMQCAAVIDQVRVGVALVDVEGRFIDAHPRYCELVGRTQEQLQALRVADITHPDDVPASLEAIHSLFAGGAPVQIEKRYVRPDGTVVWVNKNLSLVPGRGGEPDYLRGVVLDITERKLAAQHQELMLSELNHRVKNTLGSVQAIALQTLAAAPSLQAFKEDFLSRLMALSNTHNLLADDAWNGVGLREIVLSELAPYQDSAAGNGPIRGQLVGDELQLNSKTALALSMALHELATNASKYGALSVPQGRVDVNWDTRQVDGQTWLRLRWTESGGPVVSAPVRRGFGSRLIADGLSFELDGKVALEFAPAGVRCMIDVPLAESGPDAVALTSRAQLSPGTKP
ncbi:MAG: PAS domain S-box protein [Gammaproteobacteria bacterium]|nr:PAS domain S-box protein [Gammaproteobacteria bacterium]